MWCFCKPKSLQLPLHFDVRAVYAKKTLLFDSIRGMVKNQVAACSVGRNAFAKAPRTPNERERRQKAEPRSKIVKQGTVASKNSLSTKKLSRGDEPWTESAKPQQTHAVITAEDLKQFPFLSLGVSRQLVKRLKENLGITEPVEIQSLSIRPISSYRNLVIQSETGSGKTLAYLLPAIQQAKAKCHTIIAVPTRELAYQIYMEARKLAVKKDVACYVSVLK